MHNRNENIKVNFVAEFSFSTPEKLKTQKEKESKEVD